MNGEIIEKANKNRGIFSLYLVLFLLLSGMTSHLLAKGRDNFSAKYASWCIEITPQDTSASYVKDQLSSWNVGAFPIIFYSDETRWAASVSNTASLLSTNQQAEFTAGIVSKKGNVIRVSDFSNQLDCDPPTIAVNCNIKGYVYPKFEILLYNFVSLYLKPVEINAEVFNNPWWGLYAGFEVFIGIAVDMFNLFDIEHEYQVIEYKRLLADAGGPFYFPSQGLIAYYPFNANANDETDNQNHGIVHGASLTQDRFENPNKAFRFDGKDDYIEIPYSATNHSANEITVVCWFKIDSLKGHQDIIFTSQFGGYAIEFYDDNNLYWQIRVGSKYINLPVSSSEATLHTWHCVAGSYDGTTIRIYFDGTLKNE